MKLKIVIEFNFIICYKIMSDQSLCQSRLFTEALPIRKCNTGYHSPSFNSSRNSMPIKYSSAYCTSMIQPKRKFGNVHLFAQLLQKQIRSKTIAQNFERSNINMDQNIQYQKGFKGNKVRSYSKQKSKGFDFSNKNTTTQQIRPNPKAKTSQQSTMMEKKVTIKERMFRPNFNINLSIYRKKFKSKMVTKQNSLERQLYNITCYEKKQFFNKKQETVMSASRKR